MQFKSNEKKPLKIFRLIPSSSSLPLSISFIVAIILICLSLIVQPFLQPQIPLFYSLALPSQQLADKAWIFFFPIFSFLILMTHFLLILSLKKISLNLTKLFSWLTLIMLIALFIIFSRIVIITI
jgi:hypothetical protein